MARRTATLLCAAIATIALTGLPSTALADGDPASDVLLGQDVFYPYTPVTSTALARQLNAATAAADKLHAPVKVALIASPVDLGVIPDLFQKPLPYAEFLDQEISFNGPVPLLVVMPDGYGTAALPHAAVLAVAHLPPPAGKTSDDLATAAITAVARIAAAEGHPLPKAAVAGGPGISAGSDNTPIIVALLAAAAIATAIALALIARRRRTPA